MSAVRWNVGHDRGAVRRLVRATVSWLHRAGACSDGPPVARRVACSPCVVWPEFVEHSARESAVESQKFDHVCYAASLYA